MELIILSLSFIVATLGLALFTNALRRQKHFKGTLNSNCLLTRYPLLFISGPRSLFYFSSYWNTYTSLLAEHGYEVFNLQLPWRDRGERLKRLKEFLLIQEREGQRFHLVLDAYTLNEFQELLKHLKSSAILSVNSICENQITESHHRETSKLSPLPYPTKEIQFSVANPSSYFIRLSYYIHELTIGKNKILKPSSLGIDSPVLLQNYQALLRSSQELAEADFTNTKSN